ncbi:MOSC domain-containing protein [Parapedobacter sp. DT-150]|uniref:MOSC domain-containing protein n=1 Tax=Parapedobacter sp. DT-150 TaxID=3396162 RepID=UPI003F1DA884
MLRVSGLYIYPIKSLSGISLMEARVGDRGFTFDRRWMLIDRHNRFLSQREQPQMALFRVQLETTGLAVTYPGKTNLTVSFAQSYEKSEAVTIWDNTCHAMLADPTCHRWFSEALDIDCRLVYMPQSTHRRVDQRYAAGDYITSFSDAYPFLMIGQASLDDLNSRLDTPVPMNRFRPNIVFSGGEPYDEDRMNHLQIGAVPFQGVKLCSRCVVTTIDQGNGQKSKEPLKTLATYRSKNKKIMFGQNLIHHGTGIIRVGDQISIESVHTEDRFVV